MTAEPRVCETCSHGICPRLIKNPTIRGCASHTPAKGEQEIRKEEREKVLDEFPNIITCILMKRLRGVGDEILEELRKGEQP